jgi:predicted nucleic acid-binding protein
MRSVSEQDVFVSVVTLGELCRGISMRRRRDPADADRMQAWLDDEVRKAFAGRILPVTEAVALRLGELSAQRTRPVADALIAATALVHNLAVVTRNVADFADTGVVVVNPWEAP